VTGSAGHHGGARSTTIQAHAKAVADPVESETGSRVLCGRNVASMSIYRNIEIEMMSIHRSIAIETLSIPQSIESEGARWTLGFASHTCPDFHLSRPLCIGRRWIGIVTAREAHALK
jgi:hypothetical protein